MIECIKMSEEKKGKFKPGFSAKVVSFVALETTCLAI